MRHYELLLEHRYRDRVIGAKRIVGGGPRAMTIGSATSADIRLLGQEVGGIHAVLQFQNNQWVIADTGSGGGTWVQKEAILEKPLQDGSVVRIGDHELLFHTREFDEDLFVKAESTPTTDAGWIYHQVVIRRNDKVLETHLLGQNEAFTFHSGQQEIHLAAPSEFSWVTQKFGQTEVRQRLVRNQHKIWVPEFKFQTLLDPEFRVQVVSTFAVLFLLMGAIWLAPKAPEGQMQTVVMDNPYSKMIFDGKLAKQLKKQSQAISKNMKENRVSGDPGGGVAKPKEGEAKVATTKVVRNIKSAGLSALIGKISKRASKNSFAIQSVGVAANQGATGPALGSVGAVTGQTGVKGTSGAQGSYKLGAVGTVGKGGGQNVGSGMSGLGQGGVGSGDVGFVEEEGEVEGGLDRDVIARYIKTQLGQIRYCYERQLSASPDLYGKIQVKFVIQPSGAVIQQSIGTTTLKNAMVEGCILRRVASWKFPEPKNGTSVLVTYPFLFKSTN